MADHGDTYTAGSAEKHKHKLTSWITVAVLIVSSIVIGIAFVVQSVPLGVVGVVIGIIGVVLGVTGKILDDAH